MAIPVSRGGIDYPDFGTPGMPISAQVNINLSELAARLGSPLVVEQTGNVILYETFGDGLSRWIIQAIGVGTETYLGSKNVFRDGYSLAMANTGIAAAHSSIENRFPYYYSTIVGVEFWWYTESEFEQLAVILTMEIDGLALTGRIAFDGITHKLYYGNSAHVLTLIDDYGVGTLFKNEWHVIKVVINRNTGEYVRVLFDGKDYSLKGLGLSTSVALNADYMRLYFYLQGGSGAGEDVWLDNFVVTLNEPP